MFISFILYFLIWVFLYFYFLDNKVDYLNFFACISLLISICLIYMEFFSMICRGFSLQILTDIYLNQNINKENIKQNYSNGKGLDWLLLKRLDTIKKINLVTINKDMISLKNPHGYFLSKIVKFFYKIFLINRGGV